MRWLCLWVDALGIFGAIFTPDLVYGVSTKYDYLGDQGHFFWRQRVRSFLLRLARLKSPDYLALANFGFFCTSTQYGVFPSA